VLSRVADRIYFIPLHLGGATMSITLTSWMIILSLGGWLFPDAAHLTLHADEGEGRTLLLFDSASEDSRALSMADLSQGAIHPMGTLARQKAGVTLALGDSPKRMMRKAIVYSEQIDKFSTLSPDKLTSMTLADGTRLKVELSADKAIFSTTEGKRYTLYAGPVPPDLLRSEDGTMASYTPDSGKFAAWELFGAPVKLARGQKAPQPGVSPTGPAATALMFLDTWMRQSPDYTRYLSKHMDPSMKQALSTHFKALSKRMESVTVYGTVDPGHMDKLPGGLAQTLKAMARVFGPYDKVAFAEVNDKSEDTFVLLDRDENRWTIRAIVSQWAAELIPEALLKKAEQHPPYPTE